MKDELNQAQAIITLLKKNIVLIAIGVLLTLFYTVTIFLTPIVSQRLIDDVLAAVDAKRVYSGILFFVVVCTLQPFFSFFKELAFIHAAQRMLFDLRTQIFDKMLHLKYSLIEAGNSGDFISRITNDVGAISFFFTDVIAAVLNDVVLIVLIVIGMLMQSVSITIVITIGFFLFYLVNNYVSHKFEELSKISLENYDALFGSLTTTWRNIVLIKTYMLINSTLESFQGIINETKSIGIRFGKWSAMLSGVSGLIMVLSLAGIYSIGTLYIFNGTMTVGSVIALGLYFQLLSSPVMELNAVVVRYRETKPSIERITDYLNQDEEDFSLADGLADGLAAEAPPASQQAPASTPN
ncbi:MAG: ABC transporter ATP-binding protein, partial [Coriobacteriia bacterium]|nr:ABC transporter ATP-binding protein [Coriobacteriia bacterium]